MPRIVLIRLLQILMLHMPLLCGVQQGQSGLKQRPSSHQRQPENVDEGAERQLSLDEIGIQIDIDNAQPIIRIGVFASE